MEWRGGGQDPQDPSHICLINWNTPQLIWQVTLTPSWGTQAGFTANDWKVPAYVGICWLPGFLCFFFFLTLDTPVSIPLEYSDRKISARRCLPWVLLRRSDLGRGKKRGIRFPSLWNAARWVTDFTAVESDICALAEEQLPFLEAWFEILSHAKLDIVVTGFHKGGKISCRF